MYSLDELLQRIEAIERRQAAILRVLWKLRGDHKSILGHLENELGTEYILMQKQAEKVTKPTEFTAESYTFR